MCDNAGRNPRKDKTAEADFQKVSVTFWEASHATQSREHGTKRFESDLCLMTSASPAFVHVS